MTENEVGGLLPEDDAVETMVQGILVGLRGDPGNVDPELVEELRRKVSEGVVPAIRDAIPADLLRRILGGPGEDPIPVLWVEPPQATSGFYSAWGPSTVKDLYVLLGENGVEIPRGNPVIPWMPRGCDPLPGPGPLIPSNPETDAVFGRLEEEGKIRVGEGIKRCMFPRGSVKAFHEGKVPEGVEDEDLDLLVHLGFFRPDVHEWLVAPEGMDGLEKWPDKDYLVGKGVEERLAEAVSDPKGISEEKLRELQAAYREDMEDGRKALEAEWRRREEAKRRFAQRKGQFAEASASIRARESERGRKVAMFRDAVAGFVHWLDDKVEAWSISDKKQAGCCGGTCGQQGHAVMQRQHMFRQKPFPGFSQFDPEAEGSGGEWQEVFPGVHFPAGVAPFGVVDLDLGGQSVMTPDELVQGETEAQVHERDEVNEAF